MSITVKNELVTVSYTNMYIITLSLVLLMYTSLYAVCSSRGGSFVLYTWFLWECVDFSWERGEYE